MPDETAAASSCFDNNTASAISPAADAAIVGGQGHRQQQHDRNKILGFAGDEEEEEDDDENTAASPGEQQQQPPAHQQVSATSPWIRDVPVLTLDDYLDSDPVENHGDASFTGVWPSSSAMLDFLEQNAAALFGDAVHTRCRDCNLLELGSGTGWLGITVARNLFKRSGDDDDDDSNKNAATKSVSSGKVVLTDNSRAGAVLWTAANLEAAKKQGLPLQNVSVMPLDWNNATELQAVIDTAKWDIVFGSDLIYTEDGITVLARTLSSLLRNGGAKRVLYAHTVGRMPDLDVLWEAEIRACGLSVDIVAQMPVYSSDGSVWEGRSTAVYDIRLLY
jgi:Lysine methyltransferase